MEIKELKKYTTNLDTYSALDVKDLTVMSNDELDWYQREVEEGTGNLSDWDHLRVIITLRKLMSEK